MDINIFIIYVYGFLHKLLLCQNKFNKNNSTLSSKKDDFFGLETTDNYEIVYEKIKYTLEHKEENEIIDFLQNNLYINLSNSYYHSPINLIISSTTSSIFNLVVSIYICSSVRFKAPTGLFISL